MTYLRYIGPALWTWAKGIRWLWTRDRSRWEREGRLLMNGDRTEFSRRASNLITYKPGWGPWRFLPVYLTTYLAGTIAGYGVISLSRIWYERSLLMGSKPEAHLRNFASHNCKSVGCPHAFPFARFMTRLLDWAFPGSAHGRHTGPRLWGVEGIR